MTARRVFDLSLRKSSRGRPRWAPGPKTARSERVVECPARANGERTRTVDWRDRIIIDPEMLVGKPVVRGTRMSVEFLIDLLARGWTTDQVLHEYDHLQAEDIRACLHYAREVLASERVYPSPAIGQ